MVGLIAVFIYTCWTLITAGVCFATGDVLLGSVVAAVWLLVLFLLALH
jgi:hypothetical protein